MSFVQREIDRIAAVLREQADNIRYAELYAAQQALSWALEPIGFKAPFEMLTMGTQAGSEDCSEHTRPPLS